MKYDKHNRGKKYLMKYTLLIKLMLRLYIYLIRLNIDNMY